jgi:thiosulfate/3-mercaptopyruvate sulfurtransferase
MRANGRFAHPTILVTTEWVEANLNDPDIRFVEVAADTAAYHSGHIPGAIIWYRTGNGYVYAGSITQTEPTSGFNLPDLLEQSGISSDTTVVLYGDSDNRLAVDAFHLLKQFGHEDVRVIEGGRRKWLAEVRPLS